MIRVCVSTNSPPAIPLIEIGGAGRTWEQGIDYRRGVGGVVPMMRSFMRAAAGKLIEPNPYWLAVAGAETWPDYIQTNEGFRLVYAALPDKWKPGYTRFKEAIWRAMHDVKPFDFPVEDYRMFREFGNAVASKLLGLRENIDAYYVNDYQQVQLGSMIGPAAPTVFHWHGPARFESFPFGVRKFVLNQMECFDAVCVSTHRDMERLNRVAHFEKTYQVYPFLDPKESRRVGAGETFQFRLKWGLNDYPTFLCVARMDEQKRQDILLRAFAKIVKLNPDTRLMLVGDGSFSGLKVGGLASNSPNEWRDKLLALTKELGIEDKVVFTGYLLDDDLQAAYSMCEAFVLPSPVEGFGLTAIESWFHERPIIVTSGAGVSELVNPGVNGYVAVPGSVESLRGYMQEILRGTNDTIQMGKEGALSARVCHAERAVPKLKQVFEDVLAGYPSQK